MAKPQSVNAQNVQIIYADELDKMQTMLNGLLQQVKAARRLSRRRPDDLNWGHIGEVKYLSQILDEAFRFWKLSEIPPRNRQAKNIGKVR